MVHASTSGTTYTICRNESRVKGYYPHGPKLLKGAYLLGLPSLFQTVFITYISYSHFHPTVLFQRYLRPVHQEFRLDHQVPLEQRQSQNPAVNPVKGVSARYRQLVGIHSDERIVQERYSNTTYVKLYQIRTQMNPWPLLLIFKFFSLSLLISFSRKQFEVISLPLFRFSCFYFILLFI